MKTKLIIVSTVVLLILFYFWGYNLYQKTEYETIKVEIGTIQTTVAAPGKITAEKIANLSFKTTGRISYLPFKENDKVKEGQTLATVDISDLKAVQEKELKDYLDARWDFEQQRDDYNIEGDYQKSGLSDTQKRTYEKKQFVLDRSVIDVQIADRTVKNASLYAPFEAVVTQVNGQVNEWTSAFSTQALIQIVDFSTLFIEAEVNQENSDQIRVGQEATVNLDAKPNQSFEGQVYEIANATKTTAEGDTIIPIKIRFNDLVSDLKIGLEGDVQIVIEEKRDVLVVPKKAVKREGRDAFVYTWWGIKQIKIPITLGVFDGTNWEVIDGLSQSDEIAVKK